MAEPTTTTSTVPRWVVNASLALALLGLAVSGYLAIEHFTTPRLLACPESGVLDCGKVTSSPESKLFGFPVAVLGLLYFVPLTVLMTPWAWRQPRLAVVRLGMLTTGVVMVGWLVYAELFRIGAICPYCTVVHLTTLTLFALVLLTEASRDEP